MSALPRHMYRDPLDIMLGREKRSCKGCKHLTIERLFGESHQFCEKRRKPGKKCIQYKETE